MATRNILRKKLAVVDGAGFARPVTVRLVRLRTERGDASELEFRPLMSRKTRRVSLERLCRLALVESGECECLFGLPAASSSKPEAGEEFPLLKVALAGAQQAFVAGRESWQSGAEENECPFQEAGELRTSWLRGFRSAMRRAA